MTNTWSMSWWLTVIYHRFTLILVECGQLKSIWVIIYGFYNWWIWKDGYTLENAVIVVRHGDRTSMSITDGETKSICDLSTYVKPFLDSYKNCIHPKGKIPIGKNQVVQNKEGCVLMMIAVLILPHTELGPNGHWEDAPHFNFNIKAFFNCFILT